MNNSQHSLLIKIDEIIERLPVVTADEINDLADEIAQHRGVGVNGLLERQVLLQDFLRYMLLAIGGGNPDEIVKALEQVIESVEKGGFPNVRVRLYDKKLTRQMIDLASGDPNMR